MSVPSHDNISHDYMSSYYFASQQKPLSGSLSVAGDKSISHRAVIFASMAQGVSRIENLLTGEDVLCSMAIMQQLGARITSADDGIVQIQGVGSLGFAEPDNVLDMGNSGTSARLIMGAVASHPIDVFISGDDSLRKRPMSRIATPLSLGGVQSNMRAGKFLPLHLRGAKLPLPIEYESPVASAQIKSALLLYGLNVTGTTSIIEPSLSRNHTEIMLQSFGVDIACEALADGRYQVSLDGVQTLQAQDINVPGDISSAAFLMVAGLIVKGSAITLQHVGLNPTRTGLLEILQQMGADITVQNQRQSGGEQVGDIVVKYSRLKGINVPQDIAPRMIDEYPILAVAASFAEGETLMTGLNELKVKESNRLQSIADGLSLVGIKYELGDDWIKIFGNGQQQVTGQEKDAPAIATHHDHRIAMSFLVMGLCSQRPIYVDETASIATSFPSFFASLTILGAQYLGNNLDKNLGDKT